MYFLEESDFNVPQWRLELARARHQHETLVFYGLVAAAVALLLVLTVVYIRLGRWDGIRTRISHARAQGISKALKRDVRQGIVIAIGVLFALVAWSIIR
jgi:hypothetical protein